MDFKLDIKIIDGDLYLMGCGAVKIAHVGDANDWKYDNVVGDVLHNQFLDSLIEEAKNAKKLRN